MTAATLPAVNLDVDLTAEVECDVWSDIECGRPATHRVTWFHGSDNSRCETNFACRDHAAEVVRDMHTYGWECEHDCVAVVDRVMPL